ncbi:H-2 class II histocompatibility antigen, A-Q alpha chain-like isoform X1 [Acanthopagrus latus]|uniref:H-2 class II histocompatibility antigen, A-Q alpha chain-like isoform X1 n=1 Tax=Acanthopagrus latus TaxID=8177 RepID=UPI00187C9AF3|nr:H-2 class II histocompatibility antigen, A-Q alpha chain-like isoform X1 [Acanthopagrus latus]
MYFQTLLIFSAAVCICAQRSYELCHTYGCFESSDTQLTVTLDGDEVYYADFKKGVLVWESRLATMLHISWAYQDAVYYRSICKSNLLRWKPDKSAKERPKEAPEIMIYPRDDVVTEEENTLICFINHFYPPTINIKWTKNDEEIMVEDAFYKCTPNSDGTFYVFSTLSFVPKQGDIYSCTVEHESLKGPQTKFWDVETDEISNAPDVFCGLGLSLGLLGVPAGIFFFVKGSQYQNIWEA